MLNDRYKTEKNDEPHHDLTKQQYFHESYPLTNQVKKVNVFEKNECDLTLENK